jgi:DNA polymerase-3 subunit delta'
MLRRDVDESVVGAAARTPFEAAHRVFVLEAADTMNDEAANALLKTLEEPPAYVVLLLLTDRITQVLPTIASRCQPVRFDPLPPARLAERLQSRGVPPETAQACARLGLGDGERALALALGDGPALRARAEAFARAPLRGATAAELPWKPLLDQARAQGAAAREAVEAALAEELEYLPRKEHRRRATEMTERARRAERRAETEGVDHALQLAGLWYRDLGCVAAGAPELVHHADRADALREDAEGLPAAAPHQAVELVEDTRARLPLNVSFELAFEALAYRLERTLAA